MKQNNFDKYYTKPEIARQCYNFLISFLNNQKIDIDNVYFIEPSAGSGVFLDVIKQPKIGFDIMPEGKDIIKNDFLAEDISNYLNDTKHNIFIGNPPFGKNSSLALRFLNKAFEYSDIVGFILPKTFIKPSFQNKINLHYTIASQMQLPLDSFTFNNEPYKVPCVFQIWQKSSAKRETINEKTETKLFDFTYKQSADFAVRRVGGLAGKIFDDFNQYQPSSNYFIKAKVDKMLLKNVICNCFNELQQIAKNTAGNPSLAKTEFVKIIESRFYI